MPVASKKFEKLIRPVEFTKLVLTTLITLATANESPVRIVVVAVDVASASPVDVAVVCGELPVVSTVEPVESVVACVVVVVPSVPLVD